MPPKRNLQSRTRASDLQLSSLPGSTSDPRDLEEAGPSGEQQPVAQGPATQSDPTIIIQQLDEQATSVMSAALLNQVLAWLDHIKTSFNELKAENAQMRSASQAMQAVETITSPCNILPPSPAPVVPSTPSSAPAVPAASSSAPAVPAMLSSAPAVPAAPSSAPAVPAVPSSAPAVPAVLYPVSAVFRVNALTFACPSTIAHASNCSSFFIASNNEPIHSYACGPPVAVSHVSTKPISTGTCSVSITFH